MRISSDEPVICCVLQHKANAQESRKGPVSRLIILL